MSFAYKTFYNPKPVRPYSQTAITKLTKSFTSFKTISSNNSLYTPRKIYIIISNTEKKNLSIVIYYPCRKLKLQSSLSKSTGINVTSRITCDSLKDICNEVIRYIRLVLHNDNHYRVNLYDENFALITNDYSIANNSSNVLYAKVSNVIQSGRCDYHYKVKPSGFVSEDKSMTNKLLTPISPITPLAGLKGSVSTSQNDTNMMDYDFSVNMIANVLKKRRVNYDFSNGRQSQKKKIMIKNLNMKSNVYFMEKDIYSFSKDGDDSNNNIEDYYEEFKEIDNENQKNYFDLVKTIRTFINKKIDTYITSGDIKNCQGLQCNFIFVNDMKLFPIEKLRKKFIFYSFLSHYTNQFFSDICKEFYRRKNLLCFFSHFRTKTYLQELFNFYTTTINDKLFFSNNIDTNKVKISYFFFVYFILFNSSLPLNTNKNILFLILRSLKINFGTSLTFQDYVNYCLMMTKNNFVNINQKFLFCKEIISNAILTSSEITKMIQKYFSISIATTKFIINNNVTSIMTHKNRMYLHHVSAVYDNIINYYNCEM